MEQEVEPYSCSSFPNHVLGPSPTRSHLKTSFRDWLPTALDSPRRAERGIPYWLWQLGQMSDEEGRKARWINIQTKWIGFKMGSSKAKQISQFLPLRLVVKKHTFTLQALNSLFLALHIEPM